MNTKKIVIGLLAAMALTWAQAAYADNGTEMGIDDDLTVNGTTGTWADPDVEIKGFTLFGTGATPAVIANAPGNVAIRGNLQADATSYFGSSVTIAGQAVIGSSLNVSGYGVFLSTVQIGGSGSSTNLYFANAAANDGKVLKARPNGFLEWAADDAGGFTAGSQNWIPMYNGTGLAASKLMQNLSNAGVTLHDSSMTINGSFESTGAVKLGNATAGTGDVEILGAARVATTLGVTGASTFSSSATFVSSISVAGYGIFNDTVTIKNGSLKYGSGGTSGYTMKSDANGYASWTPAGAGDTIATGTADRLTKYNSSGDNIENSLLQQYGASNISMISGSSFTVNGPFESTGTVKLGNTTAGSGNVQVNGITTFVSSVTAQGNVQLGDANTDVHAINDAVDADTALKVVGDANGGTKYTAQFYSGTTGTRIAWMKRK